MKMIMFRCSIVAMIIFIPLTTIQHFIEPLSDCLLADICNHTWVPECGEDKESLHLRIFIDECDLYEYNCDNDNKYKVVNYSDCFGPVTCPTLDPKRFTKIQGIYVYLPDGRRMLYSPPTPTKTRRTTLPIRRKPGKRRYTPEKTRKIKRKTTPECAPCARAQTGQPYMNVRLPPKPQTKRTTKRATTKTTTKLTTPQIIRTGTIGTVVLKRATVWKNGMKLYKVVKGYETATTTKKEDSDFLEY